MLINTTTGKIQTFNRINFARKSFQVIYDEEPNFNNEINFKIIRPGQIKFYSPIEYLVLNDWLYLGNWNLIVGNVDNYNSINTFKLSDEIVITSMKKMGIFFLIDSFYDNSEWNVYDLL